MKTCKYCGSGAYQADPGSTSDVESTLFHCFTHVKEIADVDHWTQGQECMKSQRDILLRKVEDSSKLSDRISALSERLDTANRHAVACTNRINILEIEKSEANARFHLAQAHELTLAGIKQTLNSLLRHAMKKEGGK